MCKTAKTSSLLRSDISRELQLTGSTTDGQKDFTLLWKSCHLRWHSPLYPQTLLRICSGQSWCICQSPPKKRLWWWDWRTCPGPETPRTGTLKVRRVRGAAQERHHDFTFNAPPAVLFTPPAPPFDVNQDQIFILVLLISAGLAEFKWLPVHSARVWSPLIKITTLPTSLRHLYLYSVSGTAMQTLF